MKLKLNECLEICAEGLGWLKYSAGIGWQKADDEGSTVYNSDLRQEILSPTGRDLMEQEAERMGCGIKYCGFQNRTHRYEMLNDWEESKQEYNSHYSGFHKSKHHAVLIAFCSLVNGEQVELEDNL